MATFTLQAGRRPVVAHVVGARPNYMKTAPVYVALEQGGSVTQYLIHTGQHYDPSVRDAFLTELPLPRPHVQLEVGSGRHGEQTGRALQSLERTFLELEPDLVVVPGDVNSTLAGALAAAKLNIPVCHVESGLRSFDFTMPEEHNRRLTDHMGSLLLTHSEEATANLVGEGISTERIAFVGNTMIDTLMAAIPAARRRRVWRELGVERRGYLLVTLHRPALVDDLDLLVETMRALELVAQRLPVVFPVHPRTQARLEALGVVRSSRVLLLPPQSYGRFLSLEADAAAVLTDSGGVQEETTALGVPCFTLRENTERPVTITHGTNVLLGLRPGRVASIPAHLGERRPAVLPPLWDGSAGARAAAEITALLGCDRRTAREPARASARAARLQLATALLRQTQ
jgi:UDP-N-acetylglucosamine 2-epimerase (non-hydrolysing)